MRWMRINQLNNFVIILKYVCYNTKQSYESVPVNDFRRKEKSDGVTKSSYQITSKYY
jgi:hypothetical protein